MKKITYLLVLISLLLIVIGVLLSNSLNKSTSSNDYDKNTETTISYNGYSYELPTNWKYRADYEENGIKKMNIFTASNNIVMGSIIHTYRFSDLGYTENELFKSTSNFEELLKESDMEVSNGKLFYYKDKPIITFEYIPDKNSITKYILAYTPAYEEYYYIIRFSSSIIVNNQEETLFDYENIKIIYDMLETAKKI